MDTKVGDEDGAPINEEIPEIDNDPLLEESLQTEDENPILELTEDLKDLHYRNFHKQPGTDERILLKAEKELEGAENTKCVKTEEDEEGNANGDEMYDSEEACQDNDTFLNNAPGDEEFAEADRLIKTVTEEENAKDDVAAEDDKKPTETTPRGGRGAWCGGSVRDGAGPQSKTRQEGYH
ncbi:hypothetical protein FQA39_LY10525 [Lamprigera yunnana]|nr:hypothetical protein FQA39_LY10525 [Lamprigera yunnana]